MTVSEESTFISPESQKREKGGLKNQTKTKHNLKEVKAEDFQNLVKNMNIGFKNQNESQVGEAQRNT